MTARYALMRSDNNATIGLAAMVGFDRVAALARDAGIKSARGTPSVAIGSYDATPLEMAGAYTVFANSGLHLDPWMLASVRTPIGRRDSGLHADVAAGARSARGISDDEHDGRCAAEAKEPARACATWGLFLRRRARRAQATMHGLLDSRATCCASSGSATTTTPTSSSKERTAAAPVWAAFMKNAVQLPQYSDTHEFTPPDGVEVVSLDKATNLLSDAACPDSYDAAFLDGTAPTDPCDHPPDHRNIFQKIFGLGKPSN